MKWDGTLADTSVRGTAGARSPSAKSPPLTATPARLLSSKNLQITVNMSSVSARTSDHRGSRRPSTSAWFARRCGTRSWPSRVRRVAYHSIDHLSYEMAVRLLCVCGAGRGKGVANSPMVAKAKAEPQKLSAYDRHLREWDGMAFG